MFLQTRTRKIQTSSKNHALKKMSEQCHWNSGERGMLSRVLDNLLPIFSLDTVISGAVFSMMLNPGIKLVNLLMLEISDISIFGQVFFL